RALAHFVTRVLPEKPRSNSEAHGEMVGELLAKLRPRKRPIRPRLGDGEIIALIRRHWDDVDGQSGKMLRFLRDTLRIACEQGRLKHLFQLAKTERECAQ